MRSMWRIWCGLAGWCSVLAKATAMAVAIEPASRAPKANTRETLQAWGLPWARGSVEGVREGEREGEREGGRKRECEDERDYEREDERDVWPTVAWDEYFNYAVQLRTLMGFFETCPPAAVSDSPK